VAEGWGFAGWVVATVGYPVVIVVVPIWALANGWLAPLLTVVAITGLVVLRAWLTGRNAAVITH